MGIEPTDRTVDARPDDFEDRGCHQARVHFPKFTVHAQSIPVRSLIRIS